MLHTWMHDLRGSDKDTLRDFFDQLLEEYAHTFHGEFPSTEALPLLFVSAFVREHCSLSTPLEAKSDEDKTAEIAELIADEIASVSYTHLRAHET